MNPPPAPAQTTAPAAAPAIASTRPDTRRVPLSALMNRARIGIEDLPGAEKRGVVVTCAFNSAI